MSKSITDKNLKRKAPPIQQDESDDSSDEDVQVRIGNVPIKWYENFKHIGYDITASKVMKAEQDDKLDALIKSTEDPNWWRTIRDELNNRNIVLTKEQLITLERIRNGHMAGASAEADDYYIEFEWDNRFGLDNQPYLPKRAFQPNKWEKLRINKLVAAIKNGWIKLDQKKEEPEEEKFWDLWENSAEDDITRRKMPPVLAAPKLKLPGHAESYNPSEEYLLTEEEIKQWHETDPEDRELNFIPKKYDALRKVEAYDGLIKERFERCLDLYLCPRVRRKKLNIDPNTLLPPLPKPSELRPFPTFSNIVYHGHNAWVMSLDVDLHGQYLCSGDKSGLFIVWDVKSSRILQQIQFEGELSRVAWSKSGNTSLIAVANEKRVYIICPKLASSTVKANNEEKIAAAKTAYQAQSNHLLNWEFIEEDNELYKDGVRIIIHLENEVSFVTFHERGDYIATVSPHPLRANDQVFVHSLSKGGSQRPFTKSKGNIVQVAFHPTKPILFILTHKNVYLFNLQEQALTKKLTTGGTNNYCMSIHPGGDNVIVGTSDRDVCWFDLDLDNKPYKKMQYHKKAVREVAFHRHYPLFATASDDGDVNIFHGMVYTDLMQNPLILPLKVLKGHKATKDWGVFDVVFHPKQPWIFSAGADNKIILWT